MIKIISNAAHLRNNRRSQVVVGLGRRPVSRQAGVTRMGVLPWPAVAHPVWPVLSVGHECVGQWREKLRELL